MAKKTRTVNRRGFLRAALAGSVGLTTGCARLQRTGRELMELATEDPIQEAFRDDIKANMRSAGPRVHMADFRDQLRKYQVVGNRAFEIGGETPPEDFDTLEKKLSDPKVMQGRVESLGASWLKKPDEGLILFYNPRIPPEDLKKLLQPNIPEEIEMQEYAQRSRLNFIGPRESFNFRYLIPLLNEYDQPPDELGMVFTILQFERDNTHNRDNILQVLRDEKVVVDLFLPSNSTGRGLEVGAGIDPYHWISSEGYTLKGLLEVLDGYGKSRQVSVIHLRGYAGCPINFADITKIPYLESDIIQNIIKETLRYEEVGAKVGIVPHINERGFATLEKGVFEPQKKGEDPTGGFESSELAGFFEKEQRPKFRVARLGSKYILQLGETHLLAAHFADRFGQVDRTVPLIRRIPIFRELFTSRQYGHYAADIYFLASVVTIPRESNLWRIDPDLLREYEETSAFLGDSSTIRTVRPKGIQQIPPYEE